MADGGATGLRGRRLPASAHVPRRWRIHLTPVAVGGSAVGLPSGMVTNPAMLPARRDASECDRAGASTLTVRRTWTAQEVPIVRS